MASFSDDFNRADSDSLGANWTEAVGDADIFSNTLRLSTGSFGNIVAVYSGTACDGVDQYVKVALTNPQGFPQIILRYTNASSELYVLELDASSDTVTWYHRATPDASGTQIGSPLSVAFTEADIIGVTITGTAANTDIRIWVNPTGLPTAADNWDGDTTPDGSWLTTDPGANAVDQGTLVGIGGQQNLADTVRLDDFFGGDIPAAGGPSTEQTMAAMNQFTGTGGMIGRQWV